MSDPSDKTISRIRGALMKWGPEGFRDFPWRKNIPPWKGLITELMLVRTRAEQVLPVYNEFDRKFTSVRSLSRLGPRESTDLFKSLGLAWRVTAIASLASALVKCGGNLPDNIRDLKRLPGVGDYSAAAVLSFYMNIPTAIVDSNTVRITSRLFGLEYTPDSRRNGATNRLIQLVTPTTKNKVFNYALLDLGALVCTPTLPKCNSCPLQAECSAGTSVA